MAMAREWFDLNFTHSASTHWVLHGWVGRACQAMVKTNTETLYRPRDLKPFTHISASFLPQPAENHAYYYKKLMSHPQCKYSYLEEKHQKTTNKQDQKIPNIEVEHQPTQLFKSQIGIQNRWNYVLLLSY